LTRGLAMQPFNEHDGNTTPKTDRTNDAGRHDTPTPPRQIPTPKELQIPESKATRRLKAYAKIDALRELIGPVKSDILESLREDRDS
jgi:hypothetical protein